MKKFLLMSLISFLIDRIVKLLIILLKVGRITIVPGFFSINQVYNYGAAWSIFYGHRLFLILISILIIIFMYFIFIKDKKLDTYEIVTYGMLMGGIFGNLIDRIIYGYVIDYLDFNIFGYNFPIFNLADTFIVISIFMLVISILRGEADGSRN